MAKTKRTKKVKPGATEEQEYELHKYMQEEIRLWRTGKIGKLLTGFREVMQNAGELNEAAEHDMQKV